MADTIFTDDELAAEQLTAEDTPPEEAKAEPARDDEGRFAAKPEEVAEPEADPAHKQGTVPQGALHAEREKRKGAEAERDAMREQLAAIQAMRDRIAARQPEPIPEVTPDASGIEHLRASVETLAQQQNRAQQQQDMDRADQAEMQQLGAVIQASETEFRTTQPDYDAAIQHVVNARAQELALYGMQPAQIQQVIQQESTEIVRTAVQSGRNPAELAYQIAQSRGYRPEQRQGGAAATIAGVAAARGASRSLGQGAGSTPQSLNAETVASMSGDEFDRLYSTPEGRRAIDAL